MRNSGARTGWAVPPTTELLALVDAFHSARVLVVGDAIVDHYLYGSVSRISPEAPVPVVRVCEERYVLGGAANVVHNVVALGGVASLVAVCGTDAAGKTLERLLRPLRLADSTLHRAARRPTTLKTRLVAHGQQIARIDREETLPLSPVDHRVLVNAACKALDRAQAVIIEDYGKGVICADLVAAVCEAAHMHRIPVLVDPKSEDALMYKGVDLLTPNTAELREMAGMPVRNEAELEAAALSLLRRLRAKALLVTRGAEGMTLFRKGQAPVTIPTAAREVYDVSGAGDTVVAACALGLAVGADWATAAFLANQAAGIAVGRHGVVAVNADELRDALCRA